MFAVLGPPPGACGAFVLSRPILGRSNMELSSRADSGIRHRFMEAEPHLSGDTPADCSNDLLYNRPSVLVVWQRHQLLLLDERRPARFPSAGRGNALQSASLTRWKKAGPLSSTDRGLVDSLALLTRRQRPIRGLSSIKITFIFSNMRLSLANISVCTT
jgi:hypothetical protein